jgi:hypothetical protein
MNEEPRKRRDSGRGMKSISHGESKEHVSSIKVGNGT